MTTFLLWAGALGSGLIAGVYFAFSTFIMQALGRIDVARAIAAMNAINKTILRSLFMPLFFGSSIISVLLIIVAFIHWGEPGAGLMLLAGAIYFFGMFVCTVLFNVPLNNSLADLEPDDGGVHPVWVHYLKSWTNWNHLRTVSALATCILCIWILASDGIETHLNGKSANCGQRATCEDDIRKHSRGPTMNQKIGVRDQLILILERIGL